MIPRYASLPRQSSDMEKVKAASQAFYAALNARDPSAMAKVYAHTPYVAYIPPDWPEYASLRRNAKQVTPSVRADGEEQTEAVAISSLCGGFVLGWRYAGGPRGLRRKSKLYKWFRMPSYFRQHTLFSSAH